MQRFLLTVGICLLLLVLFPAQKVLAVNTSYKFFDENTYTLTGFPFRNFARSSQPIVFQGGKVVLSSTPDGRGSVNIWHRIILTISFPHTAVWENTIPCTTTDTTVPPIDLTHLFSPTAIDQLHNITIRFQEWCGGGTVTLGPLYLVNITDPPPEPFLDLPWAYEQKGMSFTEAALAINSFFDHEYPLLSTGLFEASESSKTVVRFDRPDQTNDSYSSHDGYDWGKSAGAKVHFKDPVLAAASGTASYVNTCGACGHVIYIDHGNGFQTRYYHLQKDGLIVDKPGEEVSVSAGQQIGNVGYSGNVLPVGEDGAHIHFMVVQDKNDDGNFDDNIPDGLVDPFGWQSNEIDPWEIYEFFFKGANRTGNRSYYLWKKKLDELDATLTANGGVFTTERFQVTFPQGAVNQEANLNMRANPFTKISDILQSVGSTISIVLTDVAGGIISDLHNPMEIEIKFSDHDLTRYNIDTMSIYSSSDGGVTWNRESTAIDWIKETAKADVDHLSLFALIADRIDTKAPVTTPEFFGEEGESGWFRSDVILALNSVDNEGGLGVDYTLYRIDDGEWNEYINPLTFTVEGQYSVEFYAVDNDENIEEIKTVTFFIDKTYPTVELSVNPNELWPPDGRMVDVDVEGKSEDEKILKTTIWVDDEYDTYDMKIIEFGQTIQLESSRDGYDWDGRWYTITGEVQDRAGNTSRAVDHVLVSHDKRGN